MKEKLKARLRVKETYMGDPITDKTALGTHTWGDPLPVTLRDEEVVISEEDPEEDPVYSHENDSPEEVDFTGKGLKLAGTFIRATREQMAAMMGGSATDKYEHPSSKLKLTKAFKFVCYDGTEVIVPNADGYVNMNLSLGKGGISKFPFKFNLKRASDKWDCDIMF